MSPKTHAALLGGLFVGVLSALPFVNAGNCCCLWTLSGGVLSSYIYQSNLDDPIHAGDGLSVGLWAGLFASIVYPLVSLPIDAAFGDVVAEWSRRLIEGPTDVPAELSTTLRQMGWAASIFFMFLVNVVFTPVGGVLGALLFRKSPARPPSPLPPVREMETMGADEATPPPPPSRPQGPPDDFRT